MLRETLFRRSSATLYMPPFARNYFLSAAPVFEAIGGKLGLPGAGLHIVGDEQLYRPVAARRTAARDRLQVRAESFCAPAPCRLSRAARESSAADRAGSKHCRARNSPPCVSPGPSMPWPRPAGDAIDRGFRLAQRCARHEKRLGGDHIILSPSAQVGGVSSRRGRARGPRRDFFRPDERAGIAEDRGGRAPAAKAGMQRRVVGNWWWRRWCCISFICSDEVHRQAWMSGCTSSATPPAAHGRHEIAVRRRRRRRGGLQHPRPNSPRPVAQQRGRDGPTAAHHHDRGNGHNYRWYDRIGNRMASYGYVVMTTVDDAGSRRPHRRHDDAGAHGRLHRPGRGGGDRGRAWATSTPAGSPGSASGARRGHGDRLRRAVRRHPHAYSL